MNLIEIVLSGVLAFGQPMPNAPQQTVKYAYRTDSLPSARDGNGGSRLACMVEL